MGITGSLTKHYSNVSVLATANCPFSVALEYAADFMSRARIRTGHGKLTFELHEDRSEQGRAHNEIRFRLHGSAWMLPEVYGAIRFRIAGAKTRIFVNENYEESLTAAGRIARALVGRRIAQATLTFLADRLVGHLENHHRLWLKTISIVKPHPTLPSISKIENAGILRAS